MRNTLKTFTVFIALLVSSAFVGYAQNFEEGAVAAKRGDYAEALRIWEPLAEQGDATAQYNLGVMYNYGRGVAQDFKTSANWFHLAAEQGAAKAQYNLGVMYYDGNGVRQDYKTARKWFQLAAEQGDAEAQFNIGLMYIYGQGVKQNTIRAYIWFNQAATNGLEEGYENRDFIAERMTPKAIAKAQLMGRKCVENNFKGC